MGESPRAFFFWEADVTVFQGKRAVREYVQVDEAPPERAFPLLCPVREAEWVPGWEYRLIHSRSGLAELGCVFTTPNPQGPETVWVTTEYEPPRRVGFVWVWPGMVAARLRFDLEGADGKTRLHASYQYTGLSEPGNAEVARYTEAWFATKMQRFQAALNHYLATATMIAAGGWE